MTYEQDNYLNRFLKVYEKQISKPVLDEVHDHYYSAITIAMGKGSTFDKALSDTHDAFGGAHGILSLEQPFQRSLSIRHREGVEQALRGYIWGRKLPATVTVFLFIFWKNSSATPAFFLAYAATGGVFLLAIHLISYHTEVMRVWLSRLLFFASFGTTILYVAFMNSLTTYLRDTNSWVLMAGWSAFQSLLLVVGWVNIRQQKSPYLRRTEETYKAG